LASSHPDLGSQVANSFDHAIDGRDFYAKKAAALVQVSQPAGPPPPPGFEAYKKNAAAGGVMGMIQQIINDSLSD
jgi:hypothetical protein